MCEGPDDEDHRRGRVQNGRQDVLAVQQFAQPARAARSGFATTIGVGIAAAPGCALSASIGSILCADAMGQSSIGSDQKKTFFGRSR